MASQNKNGGSGFVLNENIKLLRKASGLSQDELAIKLNVVRQTVSKWERGLSVPDSEMLIALAEIFETSVSKLLGENVSEPEADSMHSIAEKLEVINLQLARKRETTRRTFHWIFIASFCLLGLVFIWLFLSGSPYLDWNYNNPETAVLGVLFHIFEWVFSRLAPLIMIGLLVGIIYTRKRN